jgi:hypothetical protein
LLGQATGSHWLRVYWSLPDRYSLSEWEYSNGSWSSHGSNWWKVETGTSRWSIRTGKGSIDSRCWNPCLAGVIFRYLCAEQERWPTAKVGVTQ